MKRSIALLVCLWLAVHGLATIRRVNNTGIPTTPASPNTIPVYTTPQAAVDAADPGDTIMIEPSSVVYANVSITKRLVIIGNGYFHGALAINGNPGLQANPAGSQIQFLSFVAGADNSVLIGCTITNTLTMMASVGTVSNLIVRNNYINNLNLVGNGDNNGCQVIGNYIPGNIVTTGNGNAINFHIASNIVIGGIGINNSSGGNFWNNITNVSAAAFFLSNSSIRNNIVNNVNGGWTITNSVIQNNMCIGPHLFGSADGNIDNAVMANVFEDWTDVSTSFSADSRFQLKAGSAAIGTGFGGTDMGIFGGTTPYVLSGMVTVPAIFKLEAPPTANGPSMNVTISTKSNQ